MEYLVRGALKTFCGHHVVDIKKSANVAVLWTGND